MPIIEPSIILVHELRKRCNSPYGFSRHLKRRTLAMSYATISTIIEILYRIFFFSVTHIHPWYMSRHSIFKYDGVERGNTDYFWRFSAKRDKKSHLGFRTWVHFAPSTARLQLRTSARATNKKKCIFPHYWTFRVRPEIIIKLCHFVTGGRSGRMDVISC